MPGYNAPSRILVLMTSHSDGIGDLVMSTAALRLLRKMCPGAHITFTVPAYCAGLVRSPELADEVIAEKNAGKGFWQKLRHSFAKTWNALKYRFARYDICFMLCATKNNARRLKYLANIPVRVSSSERFGFSRQCSAYATHVIQETDRPIHLVDIFQDTIQGFFLGPPGEQVKFSREMPHIAAPDQRAELPAAPGQKRVAFCFEGSGSNQCSWPVEYFASLLDRVKKRGWYAYAAVPRGVTRYTETLASQGAKVDTFECADLTACCAWLREADLLISLDTGQVHLAAALGVPVISLGGPNPHTWPYSPSGVMLSATPGCGSGACPFKPDCQAHLQKPGVVNPCMRALKPEMVFDRACAMLEG
jgi:ADP-heptose:LPS heptosyltransferase